MLFFLFIIVYLLLSCLFCLKKCPLSNPPVPSSSKVRWELKSLQEEKKSSYLLNNCHNLDDWESKPTYTTLDLSWQWYEHIIMSLLAELNCCQNRFLSGCLLSPWNCDDPRNLSCICPPDGAVSPRRSSSSTITAPSANHIMRAIHQFSGSASPSESQNKPECIPAVSRWEVDTPWTGHQSITERERERGGKTHMLRLTPEDNLESPGKHKLQVFGLCVRMKRM